MLEKTPIIDKVSTFFHNLFRELFIKILIVDNTIELTNLLSESFKALGHACISRSSALGALEYLERSRVDMIISDLALNHINGEELALIAKHKYNTPVILTSVNYAVQNSSHFDAFILKPFEFDELLELVNLVAQAQTQIAGTARRLDAVL